jgi:formylglycine-generating enzyme
MSRRVCCMFGLLGAVLCAAGALAGVPVYTVPVGDVGNLATQTGENALVQGQGMGPPHSCGAVSYPYSIGKYEVTAGQYCAFLNAVAAADPYALYDARMWTQVSGCQIQRGGSAGSYTYSVAADYANRPVNLVSVANAWRFANWLHNGQPTGVLTGTGAQDAGLTEDGAYTLLGAMSVPQLIAVTRNANWIWAMANEDEWFKAAYYDPYKPGGAGYWVYPTCADIQHPPGHTFPDTGNNANYFYGDIMSGHFVFGPPYYRNEGGAFDHSPSPYGTFDMAGNILEWVDTLFIIQTPGVFSGYGQRGGCYSDNAYAAGVLRARSDYCFVSIMEFHPTSKLDYAGFRVVRQSFTQGDMNCDWTVDINDVPGFVAALMGGAAYTGCDITLADLDGSGTIDGDDIQWFVSALIGG